MGSRSTSFERGGHLDAGARPDNPSNEALAWNDAEVIIAKTDELRSLVHARWQERVADAFRARAWRPAQHGASGGPVPWEEVASTAVEAIWSEIESIVSPIVELLASVPDADVQSERLPPAETPPAKLWLSADEVAPLLHTTPHSLRRLAREGHSPVPAHRIGGRWWFARAQVERFLGTVD